MRSSFRLIERDGEFMWVHVALIKPEDTDCSQMTDKEFEEYVRECHQKRSSLGSLT